MPEKTPHPLERASHDETKRCIIDLSSGAFQASAHTVPLEMAHLPPYSAATYDASGLPRSLTAASLKLEASDGSERASDCLPRSH